MSILSFFRGLVTDPEPESESVETGVCPKCGTEMIPCPGELIDVPEMYLCGKCGYSVNVCPES